LQAPHTTLPSGFGQIWPVSQPEACCHACAGWSKPHDTGGTLGMMSVLLSCCGM
jgi:hypothetical protein